MEYLKSWEKKSCQLQILFPAKLSFKSEWEDKTSSDKQKLGESVYTRPDLQEF